MGKPVRITSDWAFDRGNSRPVTEVTDFVLFPCFLYINSLTGNMGNAQCPSPPSPRTPQRRTNSPKQFHYLRGALPPSNKSRPEGNTMNLFRDNLVAQRQAILAKHEQDRAKQAERDQHAEQSSNERFTPLTDRLQKMIDKIPLAIQRDGVPMALFVENLRGKFRGQASAPALGKALRSMGWIRTRQWRNESDGFSALWLPPDKPDKRATAPLTQPATQDQTPTEPLKGSVQ
jgi:hypothetical protein